MLRWRRLVLALPKGLQRVAPDTMKMTPEARACGEFDWVSVIGRKHHNHPSSHDWLWGSSLSLKESPTYFLLPLWALHKFICLTPLHCIPKCNHGGLARGWSLWTSNKIQACLQNTCCCHPVRSQWHWKYGTVNITKPINLTAQDDIKETRSWEK